VVSVKVYLVTCMGMLSGTVSSSDLRMAIRQLSVYYLCYYYVLKRLIFKMRLVKCT